MKLIVIRHGQTDTNAAQILAGHMDAQLTDAGREEVRAAIERIPKEIEHIFCSTLGRTRETCEILNVQNIPVTFTDNLKERDFGALEGKTWPQVTSEYGPEWIERDRTLTYDYTPHGGESSQQVTDRVHALLSEIRSTVPAGSKVLVVTSSGIITMMQHLAKSHDPAIRPKNAGLYVFSLKDNNELEVFNP